MHRRWRRRHVQEPVRALPAPAAKSPCTESTRLPRTPCTSRTSPTRHSRDDALAMHTARTRPARRMRLCTGFGPRARRPRHFRPILASISPEFRPLQNAQPSCAAETRQERGVRPPECPCHAARRSAAGSSRDGRIRVPAPRKCAGNFSSRIASRRRGRVPHDAPSLWFRFRTPAARRAPATSTAWRRGPRRGDGSHVVPAPSTMPCALGVLLGVRMRAVCAALVHGIRRGSPWGGCRGRLKMRRGQRRSRAAGLKTHRMYAVSVRCPT